MKLAGRQLWVLIHRWTGLALAVFLLMAGLTGSLLAFYHDLDAALAPEVHRVAAAQPGVRPLDSLALRERVEEQLPQARVNWMPLHVEPGRSAEIYVESRGGSALGYDEIFADPYTGQVLGTRMWGEPGTGAIDLMPFVYRLHYSLALGTVGSYLMGIVALLWTIDCFVGAYLTFPARPNGRRSWLARWRAAWGVRRGTAVFKLNLDLHRAGGLWLWGVLLVFAWSSVGLNLREVYNPAMRAMFELRGDTVRPSALARPIETPALDWDEGRKIARDAMADLASERGFTVKREQAIGYDSATGTYQYRVLSSLDISDRYARTTLWIDGQTGAMRSFDLPTGGAAGDTVTTWFFALHFADIGGLPYRVFVSLLGLAVAGLSGTGVYIWWRKRNARRKGASIHPRRQRRIGGRHQLGGYWAAAE